jgi:hypothetical protein
MGSRADRLIMSRETNFAVYGLAKAAIKQVFINLITLEQCVPFS